MKKPSILLAACTLLSAALAGCGSTPADTTPKEFAPHELTYGGNSEETFSKEEFIELAKAKYMKSAKYKNAYVTLTCDKPFYDEGDATEYFKDFDELRFVAIMNDEDRSFAMEKLFSLEAANFNGQYLFKEYQFSYHLARAISSFNYNISISPDLTTDIHTYYQYKVQGDYIEILFSKDYYPVKATWAFEEATFELNFKYYGVADLPNTQGEVDMETFLIHAYARANQKLTVNDMEAELTLTDAIIDAEQTIDEESGFPIMKYTTGSGKATEHATLTGLGVDKTALPIIADWRKEVTREYSSDDFSENELSFIRNYYFMPIRTYAFDSLQAITEASYYDWSRQKIEKTFSVSPLKAERRMYSLDQETGEEYVSMIYKYAFNSDGLLERFAKNTSGGMLPDDISFSFAYAKL